jgi:transcriptional regulator with XRE-family HTH domain
MLAVLLKSGLTQESVAQLMGTTKSAVSRLESLGKHTSSLLTLKKCAQAIGCDSQIKLIPRDYRTKRSGLSAKKRVAR